MKRLFTYIESGLDWCFKAGMVLASLVLFLMTLLITVDVIGRELGHDTGIAHEISGYCLVAVIFLGLAYAMKQGKHIEISLLTDRLPQATRWWLRIVTSTLGMAFIGWLFWFTLKHVMRSYALGSVSMTPLRVPLWPVQMLLPLGLALLGLAILLHIIKLIATHQVPVTGSAQEGE